MDRNLASALALGSTAIVAVVLVAVSPGTAYADDITTEAAPFKSARTRADVQSELFGRAAPVRAGANEWAMQTNHSLPLTSASTRSQAQAEYKASREHVSALLAEDSGSAYFMKSATGRNNAATMGGPGR